MAARASAMLKWTCYAALSKNCASLDEREERTDDRGDASYLRIEKSCSCRSEKVEILRESSTRKCPGVREIYSTSLVLLVSVLRAYSSSIR